jgi:hypothetical protein
LGNIFQLIYVSQASDSICYSDIQKILESAQRHNHQNEVTGLLLFKEHHFIQILEGHQESVLETLARIVKDRRNSHVRVLVESWNTKRTFERWAMAFHDGDIDQNTAHLVSELFNLATGKAQKEKEILLSMFSCFRRNSPLFLGN